MSEQKKQYLYEVTIRVRLYAENDAEARAEACYAAASGYGVSPRSQHDHGTDVREVSVTRASGFVHVPDAPRVLAESFKDKTEREKAEAEAKAEANAKAEAEAEAERVGWDR